jgi:hypothetical protein
LRDRRTRRRKGGEKKMCLGIRARSRKGEESNRRETTERQKKRRWVVSKQEVWTTGRGKQTAEWEIGGDVRWKPTKATAIGTTREGKSHEKEKKKGQDSNK